MTINAPLEVGTTPAPEPLRTLGAIVTGGGSGLGRATALVLAAEGRPVAVWDLDEAKAKAVADEAAAHGVTAIGLGVDVGDLDAVRGAATASRETIGRIGAVACCAAVLRQSPVGAINWPEWDLSIRVNLNGVAYTVESVLPYLREVGRGTSIVAVASTEALRGNPLIAAYTATKHGVLGLVRSGAQSLGPEGIRFNAVCPGAMDTPMLHVGLSTSGPEVRQAMEASIPLGYVSNPAEVAQVIRFLLSPDASYITGVPISTDGGMTA
ncbi:SDR family NAD(P)-dependent oxidoreductase [Rhodococcus jostii]|uniref:SDR family NAD(P)-dependent oxidoreductase n=1 Tax=Rhodococcus jostii TaxID=132919 RepID=UPI0036282B3A